jgi:uncharacterized glyoxalase superfamily protein PhnB
MSDTDRAVTGGDAAVSSAVEVPVPPDIAFAAFTDELDLWWVRGPINHWAGGRLREMRMEPGVGGRVLEVYEDDVLELGRITQWTPGAHLAWSSSVDDVHTNVYFESTATGTSVRVVARIAEGGQDRGGTAWTRVVPDWFPAWCAKRENAPRQVIDLARLALAVSYKRPAAAARWLADVFAFTSAGPLPDGDDPLPETDHGHPWIEFRLGNSSLMIFKQDQEQPTSVSHVPWVYVRDIENHFENAQSKGAAIIEELDSPWGLPLYTAEDLEGNRWTFAQARPTM